MEIVTGFWACWLYAGQLSDFIFLPVTEKLHETKKNLPQNHQNIYGRGFKNEGIFLSNNSRISLFWFKKCQLIK